MATQNELKTIEAGSRKRRLPAGMAGVALWLAVSFLLLWLLSLISGVAGSVFGLLQIMVGLVLLGVTGALVTRLVRQHMLWSLRNKLVLTYLLIGLAPVVLVVTLVTISAYIAAGQFAIHLADSRLQAELNQMASDNSNRARGIVRYMETHEFALPPAPTGAAAPRTDGDDTPRTRLPRATTAFMNGASTEMGPAAERTPFGLPPWATELPELEFHGMVLDGGDLYLVAVNQHRLSNKRIFTMVTSLPVDTAVMDLIAEGLGRTRLLPSRTANTTDGAQRNPASAPENDFSGRDKAETARKRAARSRVPGWVSGGDEPPGLNLADIRVRFLSSVKITDWDNGETDSIPIEVTSRPSLLYRQLFGTSLEGLFTRVYRVGLIILCVGFLVDRIAGACDGDPIEQDDYGFGNGPL